MSGDGALEPEVGHVSPVAAARTLAPAEKGGLSWAAARTLPRTVQALQRTAGNRAVNELMRAGKLPRQPRQALARTPTRVSFWISEPRFGGGTYGTTAGFEAELVGMEAVVVMKIRLIPDHNVSAIDLAAVQASAQAAFVGMWDERFYFDDQATHDRFFLRVAVQWVNSGEHHRIRLHAGTHGMDAANWYVVPDTPTTYAHELSHKMGLLDEYVDSTAVRRRIATSPGVFQDHSVMGNYLTEGNTLAEVRLRHGQALADRIGRTLRPHRRFTAAYTGTAQGERLVRWRGIRDAAAVGSANRASAAAEVTAIENDMMIPQLP